MNGYLKIKTKIDNSNVDKEIKQLEDKIKKLQEDNSKQSQTESNLQSQINKYEEMCQEADKYRQKIKELKTEQKGMFSNTGSLSAGQFTNYEIITDKIREAEVEENKLNAQIDKQASKIENVYSKLEQVKEKQTENNLKIEEFKQKIEQVNVKHIHNGIENVGKSISGQIQKIGKMALAVAGIRTAYMGVRRVISTVSTYNSQISTDLEYMGYAISNIFVPAAQGLIKLLHTLLSYVNAITSAWFGINLFSNSSAKSFEKMKKSSSSTAKSAKEIQKSLQGFDEMNVLSDNSKDSSDGITTPSFDLSGMQGEAPAWLQWILDNKDIILATLAGIASAIVAMKLSDFLVKLGLIQTALTAIQALGIGISMAGIVLLIQDIIKYIKNPSFESFLNILRDISIIVIGIATALGAWPVVIGAVIALIVVEIIKHWDTVKGILGTVGKWIYDNVITPVWNFTKGLIDFIVEIFWTLVRTIDGIATALGGILRAPFETMWELVKNVFNSIREICQGIGKVFKGIFTGDMKTTLNGFKQIFKGVFDALWSIAKAPLNLIIRGINSLIRGANRIKFDVPDWVPGLGGKTFGFNITEIPLLAKGGVISHPTQAIIGEAGTEAVVPLENNLEWLDILADKLASKIGHNGGSYIIQMDSRTIQRGIARRQQELAFATNGR